MAHLKYPQYWETVKPLLDWALTFTWEDLADTTPRVFMLSHGTLIKMFLDNPSDMDAIYMCEGKYGQVPDELARVMTTRIGKSMFREAWRGVARTSFIRELPRMLQTIADTNFIKVEVESFQVLCGRQVRHLLDLGHKQFEIIDRDMVFLGSLVKGHISTLSDDWNKPYLSFLKTYAISTGCLDMFKRERLLFPSGVPNFPTQLWQGVSIISSVGRAP